MNGEKAASDTMHIRRLLLLSLFSSPGGISSANRRGTMRLGLSASFVLADQPDFPLPLLTKDRETSHGNQTHYDSGILIFFMILNIISEIIIDSTLAQSIFFK